MPDAKLLIVEQAEGKLFNRGLMLNIGVLESSDSEYIITQDVDTNPHIHIIETLYTYPVNDNSVMGIFTSECNTLGGIIKLKRSAFLNVNGFPSNYWGWGVEDKAFQNRCEFHNYIITKNKHPNDRDINDHFVIFDDVNDKVSHDGNMRTHMTYNVYNTLDKETQSKIHMASGVNTSTYSIIEQLEPSDNVKHIKVDV